MDPHLFDAATSGKLDLNKNLTNENPCVLFQLTPQKNTALHIAATSGHSIEMVQEIHSICPLLLTHQNSKGDTALHKAVRAGKCEIVQLLINYMCRDVESFGKLRIKNMKNDNALHEALRSGHLEIAKLLIIADHVLWNTINSAGESPLYLATEKGMVEVVDLILHKCSSPYYCGPNLLTALNSAIVLQYHGSIWKKLRVILTSFHTELKEIYGYVKRSVERSLFSKELETLKKSCNHGLMVLKDSH